LRHLDLTDANYPQANILDLPFADNTFDVVISDQVFEHIEGNPERAAEECRRVLKPGGIAVHTTVFGYPLHGSPNDYWRYSPDALRWLHRSFGTIIACDGWGNRAAWLAHMFKLQFLPVPQARWHPAHWVATARNPEWMIMTWIVARK
jgi:SAM-dependent methyltransferase